MNDEQRQIAAMKRAFPNAVKFHQIEEGRWLRPDHLATEPNEGSDEGWYYENAESPPDRFYFETENEAWLGLWDDVGQDADLIDTHRAEDGELFNDYRADRAQTALDAYIAFTSDSPDESHFRDLLCDLRHLAARNGAGWHYGGPDGTRDRDLTFDEADGIASRCFAEEVHIEATRDAPKSATVARVAKAAGAPVIDLPLGTTVVTAAGPKKV